METSLKTLVLCLDLRGIEEPALENLFSEVGSFLVQLPLCQMILLESFLWVMLIRATGFMTWNYEPQRMISSFSGFHTNEIIILVQRPEWAQMYSLEVFLFYSPQW